MVVKREIECQLPVMGPFYEMIANVYAQGWVELLLTRFQWIFFFADALYSLGCFIYVINSSNSSSSKFGIECVTTRAALFIQHGDCVRPNN